MPIAATSVVSAAVIGGDLILGLSDGGIINCGRVQGPQGLKGDQGPMGATGRAGTDGNTIHTVQGAPDGSLGRDGDYAINTVVWEIYGPRSGGTWGTGTPLRGNLRGDRESKDPIFGMQSSSGDGSGGGGGVGQTYTTANLPLAGTGRLIEKSGRISVPGGNIIPEANGLKYQSNLNSWSYDSLAALDEALPVNTVSALPAKGKYDGDMVLFNGSLWIWSKGSWIEVGGAVETGAYLPLAGGEMEGDINMAHNAIHNVKDPALQKDAANREYVDQTSLKAASVASTQADWLNQTYSAGVWILQTGGAANPALQRFILTTDGFVDTSELGEAKYVSMHALGGGDFIHYQNEKPGDTLQIYGNPLSGNQIASFGIYEIEEVTEHNFPDNPDADGADFSDAFVTFTVKPLASYGTVEEDEMCQIKTMPPVGGVSSGSSVHVGENPPVGQKDGDLWYDSTRLELFVYYVDGDGNGGWVPCSPLGARVEAGEIVQQQILGRLSEGEEKQEVITGTIGAIQDDYLSKAKGGTVDGLTTITHTNAISDNSYVFNVKGSKMPEGNQVAFRVTASGAVKAGHDSSRAFMAVSPNDVVTKAYFDANKGEGGEGGGKFIDNFDHGYGTMQGSQSSPVPFNSVALLDDLGATTKAFSNIGQVLMSWDQVNPEWLTKTGHIKMTDEGSDTLRGYLTVLDYMVLEGRNVSIKVMPGKYGSNTSEINTGQRLSLTFNGVFFGTYDALWSPAS